MEYFIGIFVSLLVQWIKVSGKTGTTLTYLIVLGLSFIAAALYVFIKDTPIWPLFVEVVTISGAFYAFVITRVEDALKTGSEENREYLAQQ
jgi:hypothetical protein